MNRLTYLLVLLWVPIFIQAQEVGPFGISKGAGSLQSVPGYYLDTTGTAQEKSGRLTLGELDLSTWTEDTNPDSVAVVNGGVVGYTAPATATALGWQNAGDSISENVTFDSIQLAGAIVGDADVVAGLKTWEHTGTAVDTITISGVTANDMYLINFASDPGAPADNWFEAKEDTCIIHTGANVTGTPNYAWFRFRKY